MEVNKLIQDYLIDFEMEITPEITERVNKFYQIVSKRGIVYELTNKYAGRLKDEDQGQNFLECQIIRFEKRLKYLEEQLINASTKKVRYLLFFTKVIDISEEIKYDINNMTNEIGRYKALVEKNLGYAGRIIEDNKMELDLRNAVLMVKNNRSFSSNELLPKMLLD